MWEAAMWDVFVSLQIRIFLAFGDLRSDVVSQKKDIVDEASKGRPKTGCNHDDSILVERQFDD
jgi:hypothetical protein